MLKPALRQSLIPIAVWVLCLSICWGAGAATGPVTPAATTTATTASAQASTAGAAYTSAIKVTGPTTPFHDSITGRYNYAFGKDGPFLPSNATTANGQFVSPKSFYTCLLYTSPSPRDRQ